MKIKDNISLIIGIAIPILMIILVAASIYLPAIFSSQPKFNFLYVTGDDYYKGKQYVVQSGKLVEREVKYQEHYPPRIPRLFIHHVATNESKEISFKKAQQLSLNPNLKSPDDWKVVYGNRDYGIFPLFFSGRRDYSSMYLKGHNTSKKLNLQSPPDNRYYYYHRVRFLGWIR